jgi:hypothetical protein
MHSHSNTRGNFRIFSTALFFIAVSAAAADSSYQRLSLNEGVSIEIPRHWLVHTVVERKNFAAAGEAISQAAGIEQDTKEFSINLLAVSALPTPTGAKIRISVVRPLLFNGADLRAATAKDLQVIRSELSADMSKSMAAAGFKFLSLKTPVVETINAQSALLIEYRRTDPRTSSTWTVMRYRIPIKNKLIEFSTSYRESDATIFKPILEHVKSSLKF